MAETTISWTAGPDGSPGFTFNPWEGCQKVSPGCDNCYAETRNARWNSGEAVNWGPGAPRRRTSPQNWNKPLKWNREAEAAGTRPLVFCASLADWADNAVDPEWRRDLFDLIRATPHLFWLLLSKRPAKVMERLYLEVSDPFDTGTPMAWPRNAALGRSYVNQEEVDRDLPEHLAAGQRLGVPFTFASLEPLLGPVNLRRVSTMAYPGAEVLDGLTGVLSGLFGDYCPTRLQPLGGVIVGGESGRNARPMEQAWAEDLQRQCDAAGVTFEFKQMGGTGADKGGHLLAGRAYHWSPVIPPLEG